VDAYAVIRGEFNLIKTTTKRQQEAYGWPYSPWQNIHHFSF
jgi:hypothetical protein